MIEKDRSITRGSHDMFEALFQHASMGILVANASGEIILVNEFLLQQFGYTSASQIAGHKVELLIPTRYHQKHTTYRENYVHSSERRPMGIGRDLFGIRADGKEFPVEVSLSHYTSESERFVIAFITDISKRKEIEDALLRQKEELALVNNRIEQLNDELEEKVQQRTSLLQDALKQLELSKEELTKALSKEKELNDLKTRFVSMASHEFRTPLSTILSSASLVSKYTETNQQENRDKHIHRIKTSVKTMNDLLNEFLSLGKMEDGKITANFSLFSMPELMRTTASDMETLAKTGQHIHYQHQGKEQVNLDPNLLRNAVVNLLSNAIKFSPEHSEIEIQSAVTDTEVRVFVKDSGIGISYDDQQHLFERFFRGTNAANIQGTGLGLHIVSKYAELMNGEIQFSSELEKGTTFTLIFKPT